MSKPARAVILDAGRQLFRPEAVVRVFDAICAAYGGRPYHGPAHLVALIRGWERIRGRLRNPDAVLLAILLHDYVYNAKAAHGDNENASAAACLGLAESLLDSSLAPVAAEMIRATAGHRSDDPDTRHLLDLDLAILAAAPAEFDAFDRGVRVEYAHVSDTDWRVGRAAVLGGFLGRERIFLTDAFAECEAPARANIARLLESLAP